MREAVFILTFEEIFTNESTEQLIKTAVECESFEINDAAEQMFEGIILHKDEIDEIIKRYLKNWSINRISKVSLAVLRVAVYEMTYCDDISDEIAVSEAVKIAQSYTLKDDVNFINGVLGSYSRSRKK